MHCAACGGRLVEHTCSNRLCHRVFYRCASDRPDRPSCSQGKPFDGQCPHCRRRFGLHPLPSHKEN